MKKITPWKTFQTILFLEGRTGYTSTIDKNADRFSRKTSQCCCSSAATSWRWEVRWWISNSKKSNHWRRETSTTNNRWSFFQWVQRSICIISNIFLNHCKYVAKSKRGGLSPSRLIRHSSSECNVQKNTPLSSIEEKSAVMKNVPSSTKKQNGIVLYVVCSIRTELWCRR